MLPHRENGGTTTASNLYPGATQREHTPPAIVDFANIRWVDDWCKRCNICVEICPKDTLVLTHDAIVEAEDCIRCGLCERYCPDLAIIVLPKQGTPEWDVAVAEREANNGARMAAMSKGLEHDHSTPRHDHIPDAARGPAVAGTNPTRGMSNAESAPSVDRANPAG